jgi:2'-5' RNA ligase
MQLAYAFLVGDEVFNYSREVELEIHERFGDNPELQLPPHITLKQPFEASAGLPVFARYLDSVAASEDALGVIIRGFGVFDEGIVFLDLAPDPRLAILQRRVLRDLEAYGVRAAPIEREGYRFHCTVASGLRPTDLAAARETFAARRVEFHLPLSTLALFCRVGSAPWFVYRRAALRQP